ncbi:hypothetical protein GALL_395970 [mine drainage metagenome]|uniref:Uncharacterized protein n=1 Tax=mine drainage metagenome TaxID=410659 RepID=A0A1J5Q676_9ZZZZ
MRLMLGTAKAKRRIIGVLAAFLDDSGTHDGSPFVVIGGLFGTPLCQGSCPALYFSSNSQVGGIGQ